MTNTVTPTTSYYAVTFTRTRFDGDTLVPLTNAETTWVTSGTIAAKLDEANALPRNDRLRAQFELLSQPEAATPNSVLGFAYDHPFTISTQRLYMRDEVMTVVNVSIDNINSVADLPDSGIIDALNLLCNAVGSRLDREDVSLNDVVEQNYDSSTTLDTIIRWIYE